MVAARVPVAVAGGEVGVALSPALLLSGAIFVLSARSCSVVVGTSQGALATAAKRARSTAGSPAKSLGSAISTERWRVPGRSPSRAMESARNCWIVTAPVAFVEVWATVLLRDAS